MNPMKVLCLAVSGVLALAASSSAAPAPVAEKPVGVCWIEYGGGSAPGGFGAQGAKAAVWRNTASGLLVRHPRGDVLIDAGWSTAAVSEVNEFAPAKGAVAARILAGLTWRISAPEALSRANERAEDLKLILPTHAHFDHLAGAVDLPGAPILLAPAEIDWLADEVKAPDAVPASIIRALQGRIAPIPFHQTPYRGFATSYDLYGDGVIVVVPLPGHTPGSVGIFVNAGGRSYFDIGDATFVAEALDGGLPKNPLLRSYADNDPAEADAMVLKLAAFHRAHPEIEMLPAHDRSAWERVFGPAPRCTE